MGFYMRFFIETFFSFKRQERKYDFDFFFKETPIGTIGTV
jgi:hypothetical protein